jgi:hypothetical protein
MLTLLQYITYLGNVSYLLLTTTLAIYILDLFGVLYHIIYITRKRVLEMDKRIRLEEKV